MHSVKASVIIDKSIKMPSGSEHNESEVLEMTAERCVQGSQEEVDGEERTQMRRMGLKVRANSD